jgi:hypothetical protein
MFNDAKYSDAIIRIHNVTLPVHKLVICTQSDYFEKAFQKNFIEGASGELTFKDGSGAAYWRVFEYLYTGEYSDELSINGFEGKLVINIHRLGILTSTRRPQTTERSLCIRTS